MEFIATGCAYQGCEKVVIVLSHHAHEQNLQRRNRGKESVTDGKKWIIRGMTAIAWERRTGRGFGKPQTQ